MANEEDQCIFPKKCKAGECAFKKNCREEPQIYEPGAEAPESELLLYSCMFGHVFEVRGVRSAAPPRCYHCARAAKSSWRTHGAEASPSFGELVTDEVTYAIYRLGGYEAAARHHFGTEESVEESREALLRLIPDEVRKNIYGE